MGAFNRTIVELKYECADCLSRFVGAFNRTIVELKFVSAVVKSRSP